MRRGWGECGTSNGRARPDRCLGNFPLPPFNATCPSSMPSPSQLASSRSRQRLYPGPAAARNFIEHYLLPFPFRRTKSEIAARRRAAHSSLRVCLQWRCATPIIYGVFHLRIDCTGGDDGNVSKLIRDLRFYAHSLILFSYYAMAQREIFRLCFGFLAIRFFLQGRLYRVVLK